MKPEAHHFSRSRRVRNQIRSVVTNPYNVIVLVTVILLTYLIVFPLLDMLSTTFTLSQRDLREVAGGVPGQFTFFYWKRLLASQLSMNLLVKPLLNSLLIGVGVSVGAIALGAALAWLLEHGAARRALSAAELAEIMDFANGAGSLATTRYGAIPAMPERAEILECIAKTPRLARR